MESAACAYLAVVTLVGVGANVVLGWWWAEYVATLVLVFREAREAHAEALGSDDEEVSPMVAAASAEEEEEDRDAGDDHEGARAQPVDPC